MDEMYLNMILALPDEFFDGWEWNAGDRAILLDDHYKREVLVINTHYQIISSRVAKLLFPGSLEGCKTEEHITRLRPIPSQEQLQNKILDHWKKTAWCGYTPLSLLSEFRIFVFEKCEIREFIENKTTIIEMLLMFSMSEIYNQKWDGEKWI